VNWEEILEVHNELSVHSSNTEVTKNISIYRQSLMCRHPQLAPTKVCEQQFSIMYILVHFPATFDGPSTHVVNTEWCYTGVWLYNKCT